MQENVNARPLLTLSIYYYPVGVHHADTSRHTYNQI